MSIFTGGYGAPDHIAAVFADGAMAALSVLGVARVPEEDH